MGEIEPREFASGIPVYCRYDKIVNIKQLTPNPRNPNKHPEEQIKMLAKIIKEVGWRAPITVSNQSGLIVKGHGRLSAAQLLKVTEVPVEYQDYDSERLEWQDLMADNRIAELSTNDRRKLLNLFEEFDTGEVDFDLSGYTDEEYKKLAHSFDEFEPTTVEEKDEGMKPLKKVICPNCGEEIEVKG